MRSWIQSNRVMVIGGVALAATLVAVPEVHWLFTLLAFAMLAALAVVRPQVMVALVVISIPVQSEVMLPFVRGEITFTQLTIFALIAGWGVIFWKRRIWLDSIVVGFLLVLAAYAISFIAVSNPSNWFQETYRWAIAGVFYVICRSVVSDWRDIRMILWAMLGGVTGVTLMSVYQLQSDSLPEQFLVGGSVRVFATFGTPNTLAAYLEMTVPLLLACIPLVWLVRGDFQPYPLEKYLFILVPIGGITVLGFTQSRGGWLGFAAACVILWWQLPNRARIPTAVVAVVVAGGFLLTTPGQSQLDRFGDLREETNRELDDPSRASYEAGAGRGSLWAAAWEMLTDKPLTGVGAGEFDENYREYVPNWIDRFPRGQAHNVWLQMGAQAGVWGIIAYACWLSATVWSVVTARRRVSDHQRRWMLTGVLAVLAAYAVHSMVDYLNVLSLGLQLSVLTALALNLAPEPLTRYQTERQDRPSTSPLEVSPCVQ